VCVYIYVCVSVCVWCSMLCFESGRRNSIRCVAGKSPGKGEMMRCEAVREMSWHKKCARQVLKR
jgi:hypothetical protein